VSRKITSALLLTGGIGAIVAAFLAVRKSQRTTEAIKSAVGSPPLPPGSPPSAGPKFDARLTGYWPFTARDDEKKMEGGTKDRKGAPLHTVEDYLAGKSDHVSVSGDFEIFPYGQKILIPWGSTTITGRVTDTGGHFHGAGKVYRAIGREPLDICVLSSDTKIPDRNPTVIIVPGDNYAKGAAVSSGGFKGQMLSGSDAEVFAGTVLSKLIGEYDAS
jgi:hypothetical protein